MAVAVNKTGPALIRIDASGSGSGLEDLGYSDNGVTITEQTFYADVPGDQNGGDDGPPIEVQYLGSICRIRMQLTKYDTAVFAKIRAKLAAATAGTRPTPGTLMFAENKFFRVLIQPTTDPQNFVQCIIREAIEVNKGTKYQVAIIEFEAHANSSGVLYNATTS